MGEVTHDQANLFLRLYELRREPRLREAREWYIANYKPTSLEDMTRLAPMGSPENASVRMTISYWELAASIVNRGLIDEEFFFENTGEQWPVWGRIKEFVPALRERGKNPYQYANLEKHVNRFEQWREKRAPGSGEMMRQMMAQMQSAQNKKAKGTRKRKR